MTQLLIVEDNFICQQIYLSLLNDYQLTLAETAQQALETLTTQFFNCILLDLGLPDKPRRRITASYSRQSFA